MTSSLTLLTGTTGYIGGRLKEELEKAGHNLRLLVRHPKKLATQSISSGIRIPEMIKGDVLDIESLHSAMNGVTLAYYLIHSMGENGSFEEKDRLGAKNFGKAAKQAGVKRIIYLGGLGNEDEHLSAHLRSRHEVGEILRQSGVPVLEFRASIVIGTGSLSFEMIRSLVGRLPIMITPRWVSILAQPIAISDLIRYLVLGSEVPDSECRVYEIGGADQVSYADIMRIYAKCINKRIFMMAVPFMTPFLSSLWLGLVTPLYARVGRKLIESIVNQTIVHDNSAPKIFKFEPMGINDAIKLALSENDDNE